MRSSRTGAARRSKRSSPNGCRKMWRRPCAARPFRSIRPTTPRDTSCPMWRAGCAWVFEACASGSWLRIQTQRVKYDDRAPFYTAALIALDAAQEFILRYADLAVEQAANVDDPQRQAELRQIASTCRWLSTEPPRDFREALQAVWFLFVLLQIESNASSFSPGRFDQYHAALSDPRIWKQAGSRWSEAQELLEQLWLKFNEIVLLRSSYERALLRRLSHRLQHRGRRPACRRQRRHQPALLYVSARPGGPGHDPAQSIDPRPRKEPPGISGSRRICHRQGQRHAPGLQRRGDRSRPGQSRLAVGRGAQLRRGRLRGTVDAGQSAGLERRLHVQPDAGLRA